MTDHYGKAAEALAAVQFSDLTPAESSAMAAATAQVHAILHLAAVITHGGGEGYTTRPDANSTVIRFGPPKNETTVKVARMEAERRMAEHRERAGITVQEQQWYIEGFMQGVRWQ